MIEYKEIEGFSGEYVCCSNGEVYSLKTGVLTRLKGGSCGGYRSYSLRHKGVQTQHLGHRLIANAFIDNPNGKKEVNHIDGNKRNNCVDNLEWATRSENMKHAVSEGLFGVPTTEHLNRMRKSCGRKLACFTLDDASNLIELKESLNLSNMELARICGVSKYTIGRVVNGSNKHYKDGSLI